MRSRNINHTPRVSTDNSANLPRVRAKSSQVNSSLCSQVCIRLLAKLIFTPLHSLPCLLSCALPLLLSLPLPLSLSLSWWSIRIWLFINAQALALSHTLYSASFLSLSRSLGAHEIFAYNSRGRRWSRLIVIRRAERKQHTFRDSRRIKEKTICTSKNVKYLTQLNCD